MIEHKFKLNGSIQISGQVDFASISDKFRNVRMIDDGEGNVEIVVSKNEETPINISIEEAKIEANYLVDKLSLFESHIIDSLEYLGYINKEGRLIPPKRHIVIKGGMGMIILNTQKFYEDPERAKVFNGRNNQGLVRTFRLALGIKDKLSQFLILYGILTILNNETQSDIDKFIKGTFPDVLMVDGHNRAETIITNIRNRIAHPKNDTDLSKLTDDAEKYLGRLISLTRLGLLQKK